MLKKIFARLSVCPSAAFQTARQATSIATPPRRDCFRHGRFEDRRCIPEAPATAFGENAGGGADLLMSGDEDEAATAVHGLAVRALGGKGIRCLDVGAFVYSAKKFFTAQMWVYLRVFP